MQALQTALMALSVALTAYADTLPVSTPQQAVEAIVERLGGGLGTTTRQQIIQVIKCESSFNPQAVGKQGERGLAQIHPPSHPQVTAEQAFDPIFSVQFIINAFKAGKQNWWTCFRLLGYETSPP